MAKQNLSKYKMLFTLFLAAMLPGLFPCAARERNLMEKEKKENTFEEKSLFTINLSPLKLHLNPHLGFTTSEAQIFTALHEGLLSYNPANLQPEPAMAEKWDISDDGLKYTFHLRKGLLWSNGQKLEAAHIRDSWIKLLNPEKQREYASILDVIQGARAYRKGTGNKKDIGIEAPDEQTLIVRLNRKVPHFLQILCHYSFSAINPELNENASWLELKGFPVNGPYIYGGREEKDSAMIFIKNPRYWDQGRVKIQKIKVLFSRDSEALMERFRLYEVDWILSGWGDEKANRNQLHIHPLFSTSYFYFNNQEKPWDDPRIRTGLALLLPWEEIRKTYYLPTSRLVPTIPGYPSFHGLLKEEPEKALALLEEAGYPEGRGLPPIKIRVSSKDSPSLQLIKETWEKHLETQVIIEEIPEPAFFASLKKPDYTLAQLSWIGDYADPMTFLQMWHSDSSLNDARYKNSQYDELLKKAEGEKRYEKLGEAEKLLLMTAQVLPVSHTPAVNLIDLRFIEGWYPNVLDIHPFKYIGFKATFEIPGTI